MQYQCYTENNKTTRMMFLQMPKRLYPHHAPQNPKTEKQLLQGCHPLSKEFRVYPFVVAKNQVPVCRCMLTIYENDTNGYVGFFESEEDLQAVRYMLEFVCTVAKKQKKTALLGPIDASIFINYRWKLDHFDRIYTGEPVNLPYYADLWEQCGFEIKERYVSNQMRSVTDSDFDLRYERIYQRYCQKGYRFVSPKRQTFLYMLQDVYHLLMELYAEFPGYQSISEEQFIQLFAPLRLVLHMPMVRLVYRQSRLYAFCICVPNYGDLTLGKMTFSKWLQICHIKKNPMEYVILYVGASKSTPGLGCALIHDLRNILYQNQCTTIGALIHEGKLTERMYAQLYTDQRQYALYQKKI